MNEVPQQRLDLTVAASRLSDFFPLLQHGVLVSCRTGVTLGDLLRDQWGIAASYAKTRITTIFVNHRAIDDMDRVIVREGAIIALSGAMPGLVGATMRCGGHLAAMRGAMTHHDDAEAQDTRSGSVRLKLFNLLLPELGPLMLRQGIIMGGDELTAFWQHLDAGFWQACRGCTWNGSPEVASLLAAGKGWQAGDSVHFSVTIEG